MRHDDFFTNRSDRLRAWLNEVLSCWMAGDRTVPLAPEPWGREITDVWLSMQTPIRLTYGKGSSISAPGIGKVDGVGTAKVAFHCALADGSVIHGDEQTLEAGSNDHS